MWGGFFEFETPDSQLRRIILINTIVNGILFFAIAVGVVIVIALLVNLIRRKGKSKTQRLKNFQLIEEYFQSISNRILQAEEKLPYLKLTSNYKEVEERFNNVTLNFSHLREYYEGIKKSYSESEVNTFMNIYNILKSDLDFIEKVLKDSEEILKSEIERKEKIDKIVETLKNKEELKSKIEQLYESVCSENVLNEKFEGIKRLDEKIEYYKSLTDEKKEEYLSSLINIINREFEEKYPLVLSKSPLRAENLKREYDDLLARLKVSEPVEKLILIEEFLDKLSKISINLYREKTYGKTYNQAILDTFTQLKTQYDNIGMKFYKIDLKISEIEELLQKGESPAVVEKELEILEMLILSFEKDVTECRKLLESFSKFLQRVKLLDRADFTVLEGYKERLRNLLYECDFDSFKKLYLEAESLARNIILRRFPNKKEEFLKRTFKNFFDDLFDIF
ncbi:hypothetical protein [Caldicellulosiruptor naganoensis]|uniref:Septation ring formation regulator EzrA n=1 Tax=Caldicellulosiruptor naganoensis TaxID=29324 RepID=A0ABY7BFN8_9FIRM|nr:hypothetical protein [Caldicellulosiruptor naganoensis]WAM31632.1 hypothetical protein OTJ99_000058 [Caldicellulosiruptor naganoensis]